MIEFRLSVDALGKTRFGYSPLGEAAASLRLLANPGPGYVMRPWLRDVQSLLSDVDLTLLGAVAPPGPFAADFLFAWSNDPKITIEQQLDELSGKPAELLRPDLARCWPGRPLPPLLTNVLGDPAAGQRIADALWKYWGVAIGPYWTRIRAVLDDDLSYRGTQALTEGIFTVFEDLHPEVTLRDRRLLIDKPAHRSASYEGTQITLIPSVFVWPHLIIGHEKPNEFTLTYAARGVARVWEGLPAPDAATGDLGALVGRTRARILQSLEIPMTTTQLSRELKQSPGTVSQHLSVLRRNGLLDCWRTGRSVLYRRTPLATSVVAASDAQGGSRPTAVGSDGA